MATAPRDSVDTNTKPLVKALRKHVDQLASTIPGPNTHDDHLRRQRAAGAWVYLSAVVAWAEDHGLVDPWLRSGLRNMPSRYATCDARPVVALAQAMGGLCVHPATQWLMHPQYNPALCEGTPSDDAVQALADWWANEAPSLAFETTSGPATITGWAIGDLLQTLTNDRDAKSGLALAQTPWWICDFILDRTMLPAVEEFREQRLIRTIDPTVGTGHMIVRAMDYLWDWYTTGTVHPRSAGTPVAGGTPIPPEQALPRVIASLDGVDIDPLTAAVARLRCTVYAAHLAHQAGYATGPLRLDTIPKALVPRIGVGDSLLLGKTTRAEYTRVHPGLAALPGASFTGRDWDWDEATPTTGPAPQPVVLTHQQDTLFNLEEAA